MTLQFEAHKCAEMKAAAGEYRVIIERTHMDGTFSEWEWKRIESDRSHVTELREFVAFCPYCGKCLG